MARLKTFNNRRKRKLLASPPADPKRHLKSAIRRAIKKKRPR